MFGRKKKNKNDEYSDAAAMMIDQKAIKYASVRDPETCAERIIGRDGLVNLNSEKIALSFTGGALLEIKRENAAVARFMSNDGAVIKGHLLSNGEPVTALVYFTSPINFPK